MFEGLVQGVPAHVNVLWRLNRKAGFEAITDEGLEEEKTPIHSGGWRLIIARVLEHLNTVCSNKSFLETCQHAFSRAACSDRIDKL